ncbi:glycosyltransferase [Candidatus Kaiserbacteria bacterium]|nr:glycosyltransferase [Candidatus Kaiserbacteria bacterium]
MRVLSISTDWNVFNEDSAVARRMRMQASTVERLDVFVPHGPNQIVNLAGNATMRGFGPGQIRGTLRMLPRAVRIPRPDVVSAQDPFLIGLLGYIIARVRGARLHLQVHTDLFDANFRRHSFANRLRVLLARFLISRADAIRVVSEKIKLSMEKRGIKTRVSVLPVFVDLDALKAAQPADLKHQYPKFKKIALVVARLEPEKNVAAAIRALPEVQKVRAETGLVILGDGSERKKLELLVEKLGLTQWVVFAGSHNPNSYYKSADVLLVTSDFEGYGMVIVEALAAGCAVVSYDVGVAKEAGALIADKTEFPRTVAAVLSEGKKGKLSFPLPTETEYRDMWRAEIGSALGTAPFAPAKKEDRPTIGYVGQGWIGKNYADDFERRGFTVVRYALEEPYRQNKDKIQGCDIVFIAVPTPTTPEGFDVSIVKSALRLVGKGKTAVIKSTLLPGTTEQLQKENPDIFVMHSPEFLREATAAYDASHPDRNIAGIPEDTEEMQRRAKQVLAILPSAPFELVCSALEAELIKYAGNSWLYVKVVYINLLHDLAKKSGARYEIIRDALAGDPRIGRSHLDPVHQSGHGGKPGRGAGGHCFIKDFEVTRRLYADLLQDEYGAKFLDAAAAKNLDLLLSSEKDMDLVKGVYGDKPEEARDLLLS